MPNKTKPITDEEYMVNYSPEYVEYAVKLMENTSPRYDATFDYTKGVTLIYFNTVIPWP